MTKNISELKLGRMIAALGEFQKFKDCNESFTK